MSQAIIEREFVSLLRTRAALVLQLTLAAVFALVVLSRWPSDARADLSGGQSRTVFRIFGYGLTSALALLAGIFPASSIVRERRQGTLALLLVSPLRPWSIYFGKLAAMIGFALVILALSLPAAAACHAMGGISLRGELAPLYGLLLLLTWQMSALGLFVSSCAGSNDSALRITYMAILVLALVTLVPHALLQGMTDWKADAAETLRCVSPVSAIMEILGHGDIGAQGLVSRSGVAWRYTLFAAVSSLGLGVVTISKLNQATLDRARSSGIMTEDRGVAGRVARRFIFLLDPQRRSGGIRDFVNPIMVKEFRCRRFGRGYWLARLVSVCALLSLGLTLATTLGTVDWGVETIGGILVVMQTALILLVTPSMAAGLISTEVESGGWTLLQASPRSAASILRGKLLSVVIILALILFATLPGYMVMIYIKPGMWIQVQRVLVCLLVTAGFTIVTSAAIGSLFRTTAPATATSYAASLLLCAGTLLVWLARDSVFGHDLVESVLTLNPMAAALSVIKAPGFANYHLVPANWIVMGVATFASGAVLVYRTWRLTRPL